MDIKNSIKNFATKTLFVTGIKCICCGEELSKDSRQYSLDVCHRSMVEGALLLAGLKEDALC